MENLLGSMVAGAFGSHVGYDLGTDERHHMSIPGPLTGDWHKLLAEYGCLHSAGFWWKPKPHVRYSFESRYHATSESADEVTIKALREMGYREPRWFEYWRWNEPRPNPRVHAALKPS